MNAYREISYYTSIINNNIYFIKIEITYFPENMTHNLETDLPTNPTYILETNNNYYDIFSTSFNIPRIIEGEQFIAFYLRNNDNTGYDRYIL